MTVRRRIAYRRRRVAAEAQGTRPAGGPVIGAGPVAAETAVAGYAAVVQAIQLLHTSRLEWLGSIGGHRADRAYAFTLGYRISKQRRADAVWEAIRGKMRGDK